MLTNNRKRYLATPLGVTVVLSAFAALGSPASHAGASPFDPTGTASQVGPGAVTTPAYPGSNGDNFGTFSQTVGGNTLTYTPTVPYVGGSNGSSSGGFTLIDAPFDVDYALGTPLLETSDYNNNTTGPIQIDFSKGVGAFGVQVQDYAYDLETFTFQTYDGSTLLGTFSTGQFDNNSSQAAQNPGKSLFVGASATGGDVITKVIISSLSVDGSSGKETNYSNNFFVGPVTFAAPVPEASTFVSSGMGVLLFAGLLWRTSRRKKIAA